MKVDPDHKFVIGDRHNPGVYLASAPTFQRARQLCDQLQAENPAYSYFVMKNDDMKRRHNCDMVLGRYVGETQAMNPQPPTPRPAPPISSWHPILTPGQTQVYADGGQTIRYLRVPPGLPWEEQLEIIYEFLDTP